MTLKFKMGFNGTEPELFLTTRPSAPPSVYDGKFCRLEAIQRKDFLLWLPILLRAIFSPIWHIEVQVIEFWAIIDESLE